MCSFCRSGLCHHLNILVVLDLLVLKHYVILRSNTEYCSRQKAVGALQHKVPVSRVEYNVLNTHYSSTARDILERVSSSMVRILLLCTLIMVRHI